MNDMSKIRTTDIRETVRRQFASAMKMMPTPRDVAKYEPVVLEGNFREILASPAALRQC